MDKGANRVFVVRARMSGFYVYWSGVHWSQDNMRRYPTYNDGCRGLEEAKAAAPTWMGNRNAAVIEFGELYITDK